MNQEFNHPLRKERFMEGTRQKWMVIFLFCGAGILWAAIGSDVDVEPFMQFLTFSSLVFIGGASATSALKTYKRGNIEERRVQYGYQESYSPDHQYNGEE